MYVTSNGGTPVTLATDLGAGVLRGKQRSVFGSYLVYNEGLNTITFDKFTSSGLSSESSVTYTTTAEAAV